MRVKYHSGVGIKSAVLLSSYTWFPFSRKKVKKQLSASTKENLMDSGSGHVENNKLTFLKELCFASGFVPSYIFTSVHFLATSMDSKD